MPCRYQSRGRLGRWVALINPLWSMGGGTKMHGPGASQIWQGYGRAAACAATPGRAETWKAETRWSKSAEPARRSGVSRRALWVGLWRRGRGGRRPYPCPPTPRTVGHLAKDLPSMASGQSTIEDIGG